jgi:hypothetical protein
MTAQRKPDLPEPLRDEMARLVRSGLTLLPLGGDDGKSPLLRKWAASVPTLRQCLAIMSGAASLAFGIRLDSLLVLDLDTDDPELVARLEARFGPSPVHVRTPRGRHLYYSAGDFIPALKSEGLPVDVKTGPHEYVVAPLSERPDGGRYAYAKGMLGVDRLPPLRAFTGASGGPSAASVAVGERHNRLVKEARAMVELVDDLPELTGNLLAFRDDLPEPETMPDAEVQDIAGYFWRLRLEGKLSKGRDSVFHVHRATLDALRNVPGRSDAVALVVTLFDLHGHAPGKRFPLVWQAMREAGHTDLSRPRFDAAKRALRDCGAIQLVSKHRAGSRPQLFALHRIRPGFPDAGNVAPLRRPTVQEETRGKAKTTYVATMPGNKSGKAE